ncbi:hypothetical protein EK904_010158 [Melospiza melodia maxima]|nr:hypothetical protein EK904_010158 [Melospiza melodia maxima]
MFIPCKGTSRQERAAAQSQGSPELLGPGNGHICEVTGASEKLVNGVRYEAQAGSAHHDDLEHPVPYVRNGESLVITSLVAAWLQRVTDKHRLLVIVHRLPYNGHNENSEDHHHGQQDPATEKPVSARRRRAAGSCPVGCSHEKENIFETNTYYLTGSAKKYRNWGGGGSNYDQQGKRVFPELENANILASQGTMIVLQRPITAASETNQACCYNGYCKITVFLDAVEELPTAIGPAVCASQTLSLPEGISSTFHLLAVTPSCRELQRGNCSRPQDKKPIPQTVSYKPRNACGRNVSISPVVSGFLHSLLMPTSPAVSPWSELGESNQALDKHNTREDGGPRETRGFSQQRKAEGLTCCHKGVATLREDLHEVVSQIPASQIQTHDGMRQGIPFVDRHIVGDTISRVKDNTWERNVREQLQSPRECLEPLHTGRSKKYNKIKDFSGKWKGRRVPERKQNLNGVYLFVLPVVRPEAYRERTAWIATYIAGGFCEQSRVFLRGHTEFIVESVVPDLFHIIPVGDDAVFNWCCKERKENLFQEREEQIKEVLTEITQHPDSQSTSPKCSWGPGPQTQPRHETKPLDC